jgi:hypothetical protein
VGDRVKVSEEGVEVEGAVLGTLDEGGRWA